MELTICDGRGDNGNHCCYVAGKECRFLIRVNEQPRCALRIELGSWDAVHADHRYVEHVKPNWLRCGASDCGLFGTGLDGKPKSCCFKD